MLAETWALTIRDLKKWARTPALVFIAVFQPVVWLALFGSAFNPTSLVPDTFGAVKLAPEQLAQVRQTMLSQTFGGAPNYITYLTGGILCMILLFNSAFSGGSIIWDRRFGFLNKLLASPIPRTAIFLSKILSSAIKGMLQALVIFILALLIPNGLVLSSSFNALDFLGLFSVLILLAVGFSSLFTALAVRITKWESLFAIVNLLNLPLFFTSSALLPTSSMPDWLKGIAELNPITRAAQASRFFIIYGNLNPAQLADLTFDLTYLTIFAVLFMLAGIVATRIALKGE